MSRFDFGHGCQADISGRAHLSRVKPIHHPPFSAFAQEDQRRVPHGTVSSPGARALRGLRRRHSPSKALASPSHASKQKAEQGGTGVVLRCAHDPPVLVEHRPIAARGVDVIVGTGHPALRTDAQGRRMRRPYRLARPVPSTACLSASLILCAKMNHQIPVGP